jgi:hypothetical protein
MRHLVQLGWQQVLDKRVGADENLFEAGASSLSIIRFLALLGMETDHGLTISDVLENPTVSSLTDAIAMRVTTQVQVKNASSAARPYVHGVRRTAPTSMNQRQRLARDEVQRKKLGRRLSHHVSIAYQLRGDLNTAALAAAFGTVADRNQVLRSRFPAVEWVEIAEESHVVMAEQDLCGAVDEQVWHAVDEVCSRRFDLATGPCWRVGLLRRGVRKWILILVFDHLIIDGHSIGLFERQVAAAYSAALHARSSPDRHKGIDYYDWSDWLWGGLDDARISEIIAGWRADLGAAEPPLNLAWPSPVTVPERVGPAQVKHLLSSTAVGSLARTAAALRTTPFAILLTAFVRALTQFSDSGEPRAVLVPVANRDSSALGDVMGWISTVSLVPCVTVSRVPFTAAVEIVNNSVRALNDRGMVPLSMLLPEQAARPLRPAWAYFDILDEYVEKGLTLEGIDVSPHPATRASDDPGLFAGYELIAHKTSLGSFELIGHYNSGALYRDAAAGILRALADEIQSLGY